MCFSYRFEQFVDYALDVPMMFVYRKNKYIDCGGMSFRVIFYFLISQIFHYPSIHTIVPFNTVCSYVEWYFLRTVVS